MTNRRVNIAYNYILFPRIEERASSTVREAEERDTRPENNRIKKQAEKMESGEEMGVVTEEMGIYPTPRTLKTDSNAVRTGTELGWYGHGLTGTG